MYYSIIDSTCDYYRSLHIKGEDPLRTKSNVESYVCPEINHTHMLTNYTVSNTVFITYRIIIHDRSTKSIKEAEKHDNYSPQEPPNSTGTVDW